MKEGREQLDPQQKLAALVESYREHKKNRENLAARMDLKEAVELANNEMLDTSQYPDIPELQKKYSPFSSKEDQAEFYDRVAEEFRGKGRPEIAKAYEHAAAELRKKKE